MVGELVRVEVGWPLEEDPVDDHPSRGRGLGGGGGEGTGEGEGAEGPRDGGLSP